MDYLVIEGYKSAAEEFSKETGLEHSVDLSTIETRMHIREAVQRGDVEQAIELVNDIDPTVSPGLSLSAHGLLFAPFPGGSFPLGRIPPLFLRMITPMHHSVDLSIGSGMIQQNPNFLSEPFLPNSPAHSSLPNF